MSIETEIKKLAAGQTQLTDAIVHLTTVLEAYVAGQASGAVAIDTTKPAVSSANSESPAPAQPGQAATETKPEAVTGSAPGPINTYTMQQVNEILGSTAASMGDNGAAVRQIMGEYGAQVITQIPQDKFAEVVQKVRHLTTGVSGAPA